MSLDSSICRLCSETSKHTIFLFGPDGLKNMLNDKIANLLDVAIGREDILPQFVCVLCISKLDFMCGFKNECREVQDELRKQSAMKRKNRSRVIIEDDLDCMIESVNSPSMQDAIKAPCPSTCRLCGETKQQSERIFGPDSSTNMLHYKIIYLLDVSISREDTLPHFVCALCIGKLNALWCFKNEVHKAQADLRKMYSLQRENSSYNDSEATSIGIVEKINSGFANSDPLSCSGIETRDNIEPTVMTRLETDFSPSNHENDETIFINVDDVDYSSGEENLDNSNIECSMDDDDDDEHHHNSVKNGGVTNSNSESMSIDNVQLDVGDNSPSSVCKTHKIGTDNNENGICSNNLDMDRISEECLANDDACTGIKIPSHGGGTGESSPNDNQEIEELCQVEILSSSWSDSINTEHVHDVSASSLLEHVNLDKEGTGNSVAVEMNSIIFNGHFYKTIDHTGSDSNLIANKIPFLNVESKMGSKEMIYTVFPDASKIGSDLDLMVENDTCFYPSMKMSFDQKVSNAKNVLIECLKNMLEGGISIMPFFLGWKDIDEKFYIAFKCFICKKLLGINNQQIINHISEHLFWLCPECGKMERTLSKLRFHLKQHFSYQLTCSLCSEQLGTDFDRYVAHIRTHFKYTCSFCDFKCKNEIEWLEHLKKERRNREACTPDCFSFYENISELGSHVLSLATCGGFICGACGMSYHTEDYLKWHLKVHGLEHGRMATDNAHEAVMSFGSRKEMNPKVGNIRSHDKIHVLLNKIVAKEIPVEDFKSVRVQCGGKVQMAFVCPSCNNSQLTEKAFRTHAANHLNMSCFKCKKTFKQKSRLRSHFQICKFEPRSCKMCKTDVHLKTEKEFFEHQTFHLSKTICVYCQIILPNEKLEKHYKKMHDDEHNSKKWYCKHCDEVLIRTTKSVETFKMKHFAEKHPEKVTTYVCEICAKTYTSKIAFYQHEKKCHTSTTNDEEKECFICDYCNKKFFKKVVLINHILIHMNMKKYKCEVCSKTFKRDSYLTKHKLDMHSIKKHQCYCCDKRFTYPSALKYHMTKVHELSPQSTY